MNWGSTQQIVSVKARVQRPNDKLNSSKLTDWFQTIFLDCQKAPLLSARALPAPPPPPTVSPRFSPLCLVCVSPAFLISLASAVLSLPLATAWIARNTPATSRSVIGPRLKRPRWQRRWRKVLPSIALNVRWCRVLRETRGKAEPGLIIIIITISGPLMTGRQDSLLFTAHPHPPFASQNHQCNCRNLRLFDLMGHLYLIQHLRTGLRLCQLYKMSQAHVALHFSHSGTPGRWKEEVCGEGQDAPHRWLIDFMRQHKQGRCLASGAGRQRNCVLRQRFQTHNLSAGTKWPVHLQTYKS